MKTKVAINGFGRIGRTAFKILRDRDDIELVAINDLTDAPTLAFLLKHDSNYGTYARKVEATESSITVDDVEVKILAEKDPSNLPWKELAVDVVIESTGAFTDPDKAALHINAGAKRVIISSPPKGDGASNATTIVLGVNDQQIEGSKAVLSNASCTTNCVGPVTAVMHSAFGVEKAMMSTIHSYTADQNLQDGPHKDWRRARAAALNIVPTSTGAAISTTEVIPELVGKFDGISFRVPTPVGSVTDFTFLLKENVTKEKVNETFKQASTQPFYQGILTISEEPIVSSDIIGDSHSAIVDLPLTMVVDGNFVKVVAWYDNEWGYSNRLAELTADLGKILMNLKGS